MPVVLAADSASASAAGADAGHPEAMLEIAEAVTQCKFEATDRESDEVVLYKILQVSCEPAMNQYLQYYPLECTAYLCVLSGR